MIRKLFLIREIVSKTGEIHFRRYRVLSTPWFKIYIHQILRSDEDPHLHTHPWSFFSLLLKGSYKEHYSTDPDFGNVKSKTYKSGNTVRRHHTDAHKIELLTTSVWSLFFAIGKRHHWGYHTELGYLENEEYRLWKNSEFNLRWSTKIGKT